MYHRVTTSGEATDESGNINSFMIMGYSDLDRGNPDARWVPYAGGGIGYGNHTTSGSIDNVEVEARADGFAYELNVGISYKLNKSLDIYTQLSYIDYLFTLKEGKIDGQSVSTLPFGFVTGDVVDVGLGFRVRF